MRLRAKRRLNQPEPSQPLVVAPDDVVVTPPVLWSVEQLNALSPVTGPSHRTFVPIVRSALADHPIGDITSS